MKHPTVALDDLVTIVGGGTPSKTRPEFFQGRIPWVSPKDMKCWNVVGSEDRITQEAIDNSTTSLVDRDAVLVVIRSGILKHTLPVAINRVPVTLNQDIKALVCSDRVVPEYLARALQALSSKLLQTVRGTTADNISTDVLRALEIPIPPVAEQKRIATILERADRLRRLRRYGIEMAGNVAATLFLKQFGERAKSGRGWPKMTLEEVVQSNRGITYGIVQAGPQVPGGVPYIRTGDIVDGQIRTEGLLRTSTEIAASYKRSEVKFGDLVFSIRATVGTVALLPKVLDGANLTQGTARIAPSRGIDKRFLLWQLRTREVQDWIKQQVKGSTFLEITLARLRELPVFVPPPALQQHFAALAQRCERIMALHREALRQAEHLFQTLLHRAFTSGL